jgi:hypothetical protein
MYVRSAVFSPGAGALLLLVLVDKSAQVRRLLSTTD